MVYLPPGQGAELTADVAGRRFAVTALNRGSRLPHRRADVPPRHRSPAHAARPTWSTPALPGVDLLVRRKTGVPLVTSASTCRELELDPPAQAGLGALTVRSAVRGAGDLDAGELAFAFERLGGSLARVAASDWLGFGTTVLAEHLAEAAALLDLVYRDAPAEDVEAGRASASLMIAEAEQVADDMFRYPFQLAFAAAFGDEGLRAPGERTARHACPPYRRRRASVAPARASSGVRPVVIAVGDVDPDAGERHAGGRVSGRPGARRTARTGRDQRVGSTGGEYVQPDRVTRQGAGGARDDLSGAGAARSRPGRPRSGRRWRAGWGAAVRGAARPALAGVYGPGVQLAARPRGRAGDLHRHLARARGRGTGSDAGALDRFTREPVTEDELPQAMNYLAGQAEVARQSAGAVAAEILEAWLIGNGLADLEDPVAAFRAVTAEDVLRVARQNLDPSRRAEGVVRGTGIRSPAGG